MILTCNNLESMKIWGELIECLYDKNRYGGYIAEIYSYRLEPFISRARSQLNMIDEKEELKITHEAAINLGNIVETFIEVYKCRINIEGQKFSIWFNKIKKHKGTYYHRYHIEVKK